jgi:hypothetical protein
VSIDSDLSISEDGNEDRNEQTNQGSAGRQNNDTASKSMDKEVSLEDEDDSSVELAEDEDDQDFDDTDF